MAAGLSGILRGVQGDLRGAIIELSGEGWTPSKTNGGHIRMDHPNAAKPVFAASTPSDFRAPDNLKRDCRGALRAPLYCLSEPVSENDAMSTLQAHKAKRKSQKRRSSFIESAGQRVIEDLTQAASAPDPKRDLTPKPRNAAPKKPRRRIKPSTKTEKDTREMNMMTSMTPDEGPITAPETPTLTGQIDPAIVEEATSGDLKKLGEGAGETSPKPRPGSDLIALGIQIGLKIASGELMQIPITADMVGKTLITERGETYWVDGAAPAALGDAKKRVVRRNGKFNDAILAFLEELKGDDVPVSLIAEHMVDLGFYKARSARASVVRRLERMAEEGVVSYRTGPGEPCASHPL